MLFAIVRTGTSRRTDPAKNRLPKPVNHTSIPRVFLPEDRTEGPVNAAKTAPAHAVAGLEAILAQPESAEKARTAYLPSHCLRNLSGPIPHFHTGNSIDLAGLVLLIIFSARKPCKRRAWHGMNPSQGELP